MVPTIRQWTQSISMAMAACLPAISMCLDEMGMMEVMVEVATGCLVGNRVPATHPTTIMATTEIKDIRVDGMFFVIFHVRLSGKSIMLCYSIT